MLHFYVLVRVLLYITWFIVKYLVLAYVIYKAIFFVHRPNIAVILLLGRKTSIINQSTNSYVLAAILKICKLGEEDIIYRLGNIDFWTQRTKISLKKYFIINHS